MIERVFLIIILGVVLSLGITTKEVHAQELLAQPDASQAGQKPSADERYRALLVEKLGLSAKQEEEVRQVQEAMKERRQAALLAAQQWDMSHFSKLPPNSKAYDEKVEKTAQFIGDLEKEKILILAETRKRIFLLLNDQQKRQFLGVDK